MANRYATALVTGASSGIGRAVAKQLAHEGFKLVLMARRKERLQTLAKELQPNTPCHILACDLRDTDAVRQAINTLPETFRAIDVLVNNAGLAAGTEPAQRAEWTDWEEMISTNCMGLSHLTHAILPGMVERNCGHIVNIGSVAGIYAYCGGNAYGATKAFVEHFSRGLKTDLLGTALRVSNISPGMVGDCEFSLVRYRGDAKKAEAVYQHVEPLDPSSIAECVAWCVSRPEHVNILNMEVMATCQAPGGLATSSTPTQPANDS